MNKEHKNIFSIFIKSIGLYFSNFGKFIKYMSFPILGQFVGLILIFSLMYLYIHNLPVLSEKVNLLNNIKIFIISLILLILPGIIIYLKAFWEYLVSYGAINSMLENMLRSGKVYDFDAHTELIKRRGGKFISLWLLIGIFSLISAVPLMWIPCGIIAVYCILIFQVFTFEQDLSAIQCAKRSFQLIKGKFAQTFILAATIGAVTYLLIPKIVIYGLNHTGVTNFMSNLVTPLLTPDIFEQINEKLLYYHLQTIEVQTVANVVVMAIVSQIFIQYTLPMRSILFSMWYKELNGGIALNTTIDYEQKIKKTKSKKSHKKPSENLMEKSHKKFATKKIDRNILRRAMEKDE